jgi:hypothetical protein
MGDSEVITVGLQLGARFPTDWYNRIHEQVVLNGHLDPRLNHQWSAAWNGVAFRFDAMRSHDQAFGELIAKHGVSPAHVQRSHQERELFAFFASASSLFETFAYASWVLMAAAKVDGFALETYQDQSRVQFSRLVDKLGAALPDDPFSKALAEISDSASFMELQSIRNYLIHRSTPTRAIGFEVGEGATGTAKWNVHIHGGDDISIESSTTGERLAWSADALARLLPPMFHLASQMMGSARTP